MLEEKEEPSFGGVEFGAFSHAAIAKYVGGSSSYKEVVVRITS